MNAKLKMTIDNAANPGMPPRPTIATKIKSSHSELNDLVNECNARAVSVKQDFEEESTTYWFSDNSVIVWSGPEAWVN